MAKHTPIKKQGEIQIILLTDGDCREVHIKDNLQGSKTKVTHIVQGIALTVKRIIGYIPKEMQGYALQVIHEAIDAAVKENEG